MDQVSLNNKSVLQGGYRTAEGLPDAVEVKKATEMAARLFTHKSIAHVTVQPAMAQMVNKAKGPNGGGVSVFDDIPELDDLPLLDHDVRASILEKLLPYLRLQNEKQQLEITAARIKSALGEIKACANEQKEAAQEHVDALKDAYESNTIMKAVGWTVAILSFAAAAFTFGATLYLSFAATAAATTTTIAATTTTAAAAATTTTAATGAGAATASGVSIFQASVGLAGASVGVTTQALNESGHMKKFKEEVVAKWFQAAGMNERDAKDAAEIAVAAAQLAIQLTSGVVGGFGTAKVLAKIGISASLRQLMFWGGIGMTLASFGQQGDNIYKNAKAGYADADVMEIKEAMQLAQELLSEIQEEANELSEQIEQNLSSMYDIVGHATETELEMLDSFRA